MCAGAAGQLVAVGVVDVLPQCLSSVYFFWDPSLSALSLGKLGALKEIAYVQAASRWSSDLHYYYMGFYIHKCALCLALALSFRLGN
jgi:arginine-tRNA-protein transferase